MFVKFANYVMTFPSARRLLSRWKYDKFSKTELDGRWEFMNLGFVWPEGEKPPMLDSRDESDRLCIQLYHRLAGEADVKDKAVLEVGCGRGGGASYIARYLHPASMIGLDMSEQAIAHCRKTHNVSNLSFQQGDAERLPFPDKTFDVVLNVESSHCYGSAAQFFREVSRVLKDGGTFFWQDLKAANDDDPRLANTSKSQVPSSLTLIREADITEPVVEAMDIMDEARRKTLLRGFGKILEKAVAEEWALKGSKFYDDMVAKKILYLSRTYTKK